MTKYPLKNLYLDVETITILKALAPTRTESEFVRLLIKSSRLNTDTKSRDLAKRELDLFVEKLKMEN